ncbi:MAG: MerR family transcriptional regulator [Oscillospiraceae bacterium]|nr:MerR family transcriptional regulator [Oscillospiraceae bacterium]
MNRKNKLLSIGEMSKLTGASLRSLRYYETINLLTPAYIDPETGYRYYAFEQSYHIEMIRFCIELDIPLKELPSFVGAGDTLDYRAFLSHGRQIAKQKIKALRNGLKLIGTIEAQMDLMDAYELGQLYTREIPEKCFDCKPCKPPLNEIDPFELVMSFFDGSYSNDDQKDTLEYGFLREHTPAGSAYYAFIEVPKRLASKHTKRIPAATYFCRQGENPQIENTQEIFKENLLGKGSYLAIETEIFTSKYKIGKPLHELRVIVL